MFLSKGGLYFKVREHQLLSIMETRRDKMKRWMLGLLAVLFSATLATAQQQPPTPAPPPRGEMPQIVAFDNDGLLGDHIHIFGNTPDLGKWGNSISSMVILAGRWEFFDEEKFQGTKVELGPGVYLHVKDHGIKDNSISSIRLVGSPPMAR
jgi:hypothetical protein